MASDAWTVESAEELRALYPPANERSRLKQLDRLDEHCRAFIAASPFFVLATYGPGGVDCSPRGDPPGSVLVADEKTLLIADRRGNNRLDSLANMVQNPAVGLLFLVPGVNETLRVNGRARVTTHPDLLARLEMDGRPPVSVVEVTVDEAFVQCGRALLRAELWSPDARVERTAVPSMGTMLAAHTGVSWMPPRTTRIFPSACSASCTETLIHGGTASSQTKHGAGREETPRPARAFHLIPPSSCR